MKACKVEAKIEPDGSITLRDLPFATGEVVEIIVLNKSTSVTPDIAKSSQTRVPDLAKGQIWIFDDFNAPLPDEFWLGRDLNEAIIASA